MAKSQDDTFLNSPSTSPYTSPYTSGPASPPGASEDQTEQAERLKGTETGMGFAPPAAPLLGHPIEPQLPDPQLPDLQLPGPQLPDPQLPDPDLPDPQLPDLSDPYLPGLPERPAIPPLPKPRTIIPELREDYIV
jgi:hypothetical protein